MLTSCFNKIEDEYLVINLGASISSYNPKFSNDQMTNNLNYLVNEGLIKYDEETSSYLPALAKEFKEYDKKLIFVIRDDIYWSNGDKITIDDFIYGFKIALSKETAARNADMLFSIKNASEYNKGNVDFSEVGIKKINDKTLEIELNEITSYFKYILTLPISYPLNEKFYTENKNNYGTSSETTLYSGAYIIKSSNDTEVYLEKNNKYYDSQNVNIKDIKLIGINNFKTVNNLIENDELNITRIEFDKIEEYKKKNELYSYYNGRIWYLQYNLENNIISNINFRKAISFIIDRVEYVEKVKNDGSKPAKSLVSDVIDGYNGKYRLKYDDSKYIEYDVNIAKKYLEKALKELNLSIEDINNKKLVLLSGNSDPEIKEIQYIQEQIRKKLGINFSIVVATYQERLELTRNGKYDIVLNTWSPKYQDVSSILVRWYRPNDNKLNDKYRKLEFEKYYNNAINMKNSNERDMNFNKAEKILIDDVVVTPLYFSIENIYISKKIKKFKILNISSIFDVKNSKIEK